MFWLFIWFPGSLATHYKLATSKQNVVTQFWPEDWQWQDTGEGLFDAGDPSGDSFISGNVELLTPQMRVNPPGILVSPYLAPGQAWQFITARYGLAANTEPEFGWMYTPPVFTSVTPAPT